MWGQPPRLSAARSAASPFTTSPLSARASELALAQLHVHSPPAEAHAFGFKPQSLFDGRIAAQFDLSTRTPNPLPRQPESSMQYLRYHPRSPGKSRRARNRSIGGHFTLRNAPNHCFNANPPIRRFVCKRLSRGSIFRELI